MTEKIIFFDTTLRDGEQASGFHMFLEEKLAVATQLAKLGVDVIEAGFPVSSPGDFRSVYRISQEIGTEKGPIICALARAKKQDIDSAAKALEPAKRKRIHTFIATSDIHVNGKFNKDRKWVRKTAIEAVKHAKSYVDDVEFSCEDFGRSDLDYIVDVASAAIQAGATTINLPDTVGWLMPNEAYDRVEYVMNNIRNNGLDAIFSVHNHNDFGMATANTIEEIRAGVRQVEVTINGIGERAGNTALEEIVAILKTRRSKNFNFDFNINTKLIGETSKLVAEVTGIDPQPNKAIVGRNAFAHEAGIHQDGVMKNPETYETMDPTDYGVESIITFGPRSGRNALRARYKELGIDLTEEKFERTAKRFTELADNRKTTDDADLFLALQGDKKITNQIEFVSYNSVPEGEFFRSQVELRVNGKHQSNYARGNGQIDASINAIKEIINRGDLRLGDYRSIAKGKGSSAFAYTAIALSKNGWETRGFSTHHDVVTGAITSFVEGVNRMLYVENYFKASA